MDERSLNRWADAYARAWEQADADAVVELFTPDASYRSSIFDEPHSGADGIRAYWERATSSQSNVRVWMGDPLVDGDRSAPLRDPEAGGIAGYLDRCFPEESDVKSRFDVWAASGDQALTIYLATLHDDSLGGDVTIAGCDMLRFSDRGLCVEQRDYWNVSLGRVPDGHAWPA